MNPSRYLAAERALLADAGIDPAERWLDLPSGPRVRVLEHGTGAPVLFLHGGPDAAATWAYVAAATHGVRCLLLDRPGCGRSEPPAAVPDNRTVARYVADLTAQVLDGLGLDRVVVVGSSFGGFSALRSALAHPRRVAGIVLAGCPAFVPGWTAPAFFSLLRTPMLGRLLLALPASAGSVRMSLRQMGHSSSLASGRISAPMLEWMRAWGRDTPTMRNDAAMIVACGTWRRGFDPALDLAAEELARIDVPVSLRFGASDPVGGCQIAERLGAALPNAAVDCLPDAGHLPWLDDPAWLAAGIRTIVDRVSMA
jgi:pimeloyl-ACP methyl ester carboxylesterase